MIEQTIDFGLRLLWTQALLRKAQSDLVEARQRIDYLERQLEPDPPAPEEN